MATAYAIYLAPNIAKERDRFLLIALDLIYMATDMVKTLNLKAIEYVANNKLLVNVAQALKNAKDNEKASQA
jgi:hypothetical protein